MEKKKKKKKKAFISSVNQINGIFSLGFRVANWIYPMDHWVLTLTQKCQLGADAGKVKGNFHNITVNDL